METKNPYARNRLDYVANLVQPKKSDKILNIGVSNIPEVEMALEKEVKECWTIDLDRTKLEKAKPYVSKSKFIYGDITKPFPFNANSIDTVIVLEVLEHIKDDRAVIKEIYRVLKKGGKIIVTVPNKSWWHIINPVKYFEHERHYSNELIVSRLKEAGFKVDHLNVVESWTLLLNLYIHLFRKFILRNSKNFCVFTKSADNSYRQQNKRGLDIIVRAVKV